MARPTKCKQRFLGAKLSKALGAVFDRPEHAPRSGRVAIGQHALQIGNFVRDGSCVTSIAGPNGAAQLYWR